MTPDDSQLIAYADGELGAAEAASVERALAESPDLQQSVEWLRASRLPYREAFAVQKLPPLPDELRLRIEALASASSASSIASASVSTPQQRDETAAQSPQRSRPRAWLIAAFVAGAFGAGLVQWFGSVWPGASGNGAVSVAAANARPWVDVAADYQQMYSRETVADVSPDPAVSADTVAAIRNVDGIRLRMPDLQRAGLSFKSVERLRYNGKPLVQIVYLPSHGTPVALCVMKDSRPDQSVAQRQSHGMAVVSWRRNELSYALIGKPDSGDLQAIAQQIADGDVDALFAARETAVTAQRTAG
ncbi:anti-sigma factor [Paraburkholderia xenovorans]|uniref:anti-sigma factor family protein n=1 Tax=Paraburkholderia xenovorans TaxID=36873 RepID=UPI0038BD7D6D